MFAIIVHLIYPVGWLVRNKKKDSLQYCKDDHRPNMDKKNWKETRKRQSVYDRHSFTTF